MILEPLLRRLYCVVEVERYVHTKGLTRAQAWEVFDTVLGNKPDAHLAASEMDGFLHSSFNARSTFLANARKETKDAKPPSK